MTKKSNKDKISTGPAPDLTNKRIGMIVFSYYPRDPRVYREALALREAGMAVDIICLRDHPEASREVIDGITVHRVNLQQRRGKKLRYLWEYFYFLVAAFFKISALHIKHRYQIVHIHNMPDILILSALIPKLTGARLILDLHDPMPEVFETKYDVTSDHRLIKTMRFLEWVSIGMADFVLTPNIAFRELFVDRGCSPEKIEIVMNSPIEKIFDREKLAGTAVARRNGDADKFIVMYHGTIVERHGIREAIDAIKQLRRKIPNIHFRIFGNGNFREGFLEYLKAAEMGDSVSYGGNVSLQQIAEEISQVDLGLIPNNMSAFTNLNFPTRIFEYLSLGKPVVISNTRGVRDYFEDNSIFYFEAGNVASMAEAIQKVYQDKKRRQSTLDNGMAIYEKHCWQRQKEVLLKVVYQLV